MKSFIAKLVLMVIGILAFQTNSAISGDINIIGSWIRTQNATDSSGNLCPFVPESFVFFNNQTMMMSNIGSQALPYKASATSDEKQIIEKRIPEYTGKNLLFIIPSPNFDWTNTPMVYAYSIDKDELTLTVQNWSPAKFTRYKKR